MGFGIGKKLKKATRKVAKIATKPLNSIAKHIPGGDFIVPAALTIANPALGAAYAGANVYAKGGNIGDALKSAGLSYAASNIGNAIGSKVGAKLGTFGDAASNVGVNLGYSTAGSTLPSLAALEAGNVASSSIGSQIGNYLGSAAPQFASNVANASIGGALGSYAANNLVSSATNSEQEPTGLSGPTPFSPSQESAQNAPASLSALGSLTNEQQSTSLANQGVYGGGNGPEEQSYFLNLLNRRLVDTGGNVQKNAQLAPIEQSYLQRIGINASGDSSNLLEAINRWRQTQAQSA